MNIKYPVLLNSNGEIQDQGGKVLLTIKNYFIGNGEKEFGDGVVVALNNLTLVPEVSVDPLTKLLPGDIIRQVGLDLIVVTKEWFDERENVQLNGRGHAPENPADKVSIVEVNPFALPESVQSEISKTDKRKYDTLQKKLGKFTEKMKGKYAKEIAQT